MEGLDAKKKFPEERLAEAVITISPHCESPQRGIQSVIDNAGYFGDAVHLVKYGYDTKRLLYPQWPEDVKRMEKLGLRIVWHSDFDPSLLTHRAIIHVPPDAQVSDGALEVLYRDMSAWNVWCTQFSVSSVTYLNDEHYSWKNPQDILNALTYGFLLVILMMDTFRAWWQLGCYYRTQDLRAQTVYMTYPNRTEVARERRLLWSMLSQTFWCRRGDAALLQAPEYADSGANFVLRTIREHNRMGLGFWYIGYLMYYLLFAWPWWGATYSQSESIMGYILNRNMASAFWISAYSFHTLVVAIVAWIYMEFPLRMLPVQVFFYTFYLTLSPLVFFYGRIHRSHASWIKK